MFVLLVVDSNEYVWIGCNDIAHEGRFVWSHNNQVVTYSKWYKGEPNNNGNEDCCHTLKNSGAWNDLKCDSRLDAFICKKEVNLFIYFQQGRDQNDKCSKAKAQST